MSAGRQLFRKTEIARACKAVVENGLCVTKVTISEGKIEIETGPPTAPAGNANDDEWTDWTPTDGKTAA
jgi:hypothetical protein